MESSPDNVRQSELPRNLSEEVANAGLFLNKNKDPSATTIRRFEDRLNRHGEAMKLLRYSAVIGPVFTQEAERLVTDQDAIVSFTDIAIKSLSLNKSTHSNAYRTYVEIEDVHKKEDSRTHFIPYNDIILVPEHDEETIAIKTICDLHYQTAQCYKALKDYPYLPANDQEAILNQLAEDAGDIFMRNYSQANVIIVAPVFYKVPKADKGATLKKIISIDETAQHANSPIGPVLRCAFIEQIIPIQTPDGQLEVNEPCIVLSDKHGNPGYFIPISQIKDIVRLDTETDEL